MSREDAAVCHGMMGGIPAYIEKSDPVAPLKDNIKRLFLTPTGYLFAECKWRNEPVGEDVLQKPVHRSELFRRQRKSYALFSKRGFTQGCRDAAESRGDVKLISFAEM